MQPSRYRKEERQFFDVYVRKTRGRFDRFLEWLDRRFWGVASRIRRRHVINLRPSFVKRYPYFIGAAGILFVLGIFIGNKVLTRAEVADYYPSNCLGTWQNAQNAAGQPESLNAATAGGGFSPENVAVYQLPGSQIFCGGFLSPEAETKGNLKSVALTLVWDVEGAPLLPTSTVSVQELPENTSTSNASGTPPETIPPPEASSTLDKEQSWSTPPFFSLFFGSMNAKAQEGPVGPAAEPIPQPVVVPETVPMSPSTLEPVPLPVEESSQISPGETPADADAMAGKLEDKPPTIILPPLKATLDENTAATSTVIDLPISTSTRPTSTEALTPTILPPDDRFLKVQYSLDGTNWIEIGKVDPSNWQNLTINLPVTSWAELKQLQISIVGIPTTLNPIPRVYLAGMYIEAHYDRPPFFGGTEEDLEAGTSDGLPIIALGDDLKLIVEGTHDVSFGANEAPEFDLDLGRIPRQNGLAAEATSTTSSTTTTSPTTSSGSSETATAPPPPFPAGEPVAEPAPSPPTAPGPGIMSSSTVTEPPAPPEENNSGTSEVAPPPPPEPSSATPPTPPPAVDPPAPPTPSSSAKATEDKAQSSNGMPAVAKKAPSKTSWGWLKFMTDAVNPVDAPPAAAQEGTPPGDAPSADSSGPFDPAQGKPPEPQKRPTASHPVVAKVFDPEGSETDIAPTFTTVGSTVRVNVPEPKSKFRPGRYTLKMWILRDNAIYYTEQSFIWGVLAVNFSKSIYQIGDTVRASFGVLTDNGQTVCDADITMTVKTPSGDDIIRSTDNGTISRNDTCGRNNVTQNPDYSSEFSVAVSGKYEATIRVTNSNGTREFNDAFEVQDVPAFDVERTGPTRIFPPADYSMRIVVTANQDYQGDIVEKLPEGFTVTPIGGGNVDASGGEVKITKAVNLKAGETVMLAYQFNAPDVSPELFKLGPLQIGAWQEIRQWQLASDIVVGNNSMLVYSDTVDADNLNFRIQIPTSTFGGETLSLDVIAGALTSYNIVHTVIKAAPTRNEYVIGDLNAGGGLNFIRASGTTWSNLLFTSSSAAQPECGKTASTTFTGCYQSYDVAYEQLSGRALMAYSRNATSGILYYVTWNGNATSAEASFFYKPGGGQPRWVRLIPQGDMLTTNRSNQILALVSDSNNDLFGMLWDGTQFVNTTTLTTEAPYGDLQYFNGAWETLTGNAVTVFASGTVATTTPFSYQLFVGGAWSTSGTMPALSSTLGAWVTMASDPLTDRVSVGLSAGISTSNSQDGKAWPAIWRATTSSATWTLGLGDTSLEGPASTLMQTGWLRYGSSTSYGTSSSALFTYIDQGTSDGSDYTIWSSPSFFRAVTDIPGAWTDDASARKLISSPNANDMMWIGIDSDSDLRTQNFDGLASWGIGPSAEWGAAVGTSTDKSSSTINNAFGYAYKLYSPWTLNWRWYAGTSTENTPTISLAAENASTTNVLFTGGKVRLRFNVAELGGNAASDTRITLQWTTSSNPDASTSIWTDVGNIGSSTMWQYYDVSSTNAGNDGVVLAGTVLSSSSVAGWWNTSYNGTASGTMDQTSSSILELEFPIQSNNALASTTFYFRMYQMFSTSTGSYSYGTPIYRQQTSFPATPCSSVSVCTYPQLKTSDVFNSAPSVSNVTLNSGSSIVLTVNTTTTINVSFTVSDDTGCTDVFSLGNVTTTIYRSGVSSTCALSNPAASSLNLLNCYLVATTTNNCAAETSANATATFAVWYFGEATDASSSYPTENWQAFVSVRDSSSTIATGTSSGVELLTLLGFDVATSTGYGSLAPNTNSGATNTIVWIKNTGNASTTLNLSGTALTFGANVMATSSQHYATSTFTFGGVEQALQDVATAVSGFLIPPPIMNKRWQTTTAMPSARSRFSAASDGTRIYIVGGAIDATLTPTSSAIFTTVRGDGTIGNWSSTTALPSALRDSACVVYNNYIYHSGGFTGPTSSVFFSAISATGSIMSWATTTPLLATRATHASVGYNGYLYVIGGAQTVTSTPTSSVLFSLISSTGSLNVWSTTTALPSAVDYVSAFANSGTLYAVAGLDGSNPTSSVWSAPINSTGSVGVWSLVSRLQTPLYETNVAFDQGIIYTAGGSVNSSESPTTTSLFALTLPTGSTTDWSTGTSLPTAITGNQVQDANGYLYSLGGAILGWTPTTTVNYTSIASRNTYWGITVPTGLPTGYYTGLNTFTAVWSP